MSEQNIVYEVSVPKAKAMARVRVVVKGKALAMFRSRVAMVIFRIGAWVGGFHSVEFYHGKLRD